MTTSGVIEYPIEKLLELEQLRKEHKFFIIFDETVTGLGRTEINRSITPDIIIVSKGLTNGIFPFSATLVSGEIMYYIQHANKVFDYGITMSGHPIGSALLLKSIELYHNTSDKRKQLEIDIVNKLKNVNFRNYGLLFGIEMPNGDVARKELKKLGYIIRNYENTLIFAPMFIADISKYQRFFDYIQTTVLLDH
jgi:adenosylmethionine-8-amino-7-oxononanoate aminotransferase